MRSLKLDNIFMGARTSIWGGHSPPFGGGVLEILTLNIVSILVPCFDLGSQGLFGQSTFLLFNLHVTDIP